MAELDPLVDPDYRYSINRLLGDGDKVVWDLVFAGGYISKEHIKLYLINADDTTSVLPFEWVTDTSINITPPIADGLTAIAYRDTPKDAPLVDFTSGSAFTEANLDILSEQAVFAAAETIDRFSDVRDVSNAASTLALAATEDVATATAVATAAGVTADAALVVANDAATLADATADQFDALISTVEDIVGEDLSQLARLDTPQTFSAEQNIRGLYVSNSDDSLRTQFYPTGQFRTFSGTWSGIKAINAWVDLTGKPTTFAPAAHTHAIADVVDLLTNLNFKLNVIDYKWSTLAEKPTTFPPAAHTQPWSTITDAPAFKPITISTSAPSGGTDGDVWIVYNA